MEISYAIHMFNDIMLDKLMHPSLQILSLTWIPYALGNVLLDIANFYPLRIYFSYL